MSSSHLGESRSDETRERMSIAQRARRERERQDPLTRRMRLLHDAHALEDEADALRNGASAMSGRSVGYTSTMASRNAS
jgi:hypothetical protein